MNFVVNRLHGPHYSMLIFYTCCCTCKDETVLRWPIPENPKYLANDGQTANYLIRSTSLLCLVSGPQNVWNSTFTLVSLAAAHQQHGSSQCTHTGAHVHHGCCFCTLITLPQQHRAHIHVYKTHFWLILIAALKRRHRHSTPRLLYYRPTLEVKELLFNACWLANTVN